VTLFVTREARKIYNTTGGNKNLRCDAMGIIKMSQKLVADAKMVMKPGANLEFGRYLHQANSPSNTGLLPTTFSISPLPHTTRQIPLWCARRKLKLESTQFAAPPHGLMKPNDQPELQAVPRGRGVFEADGLW
jgi:hypothetical protein